MPQETCCWWWVDTGFACGAVVVRDDVIGAAAPIFRRWSVGKKWSFWRKGRRGWSFAVLSDAL